MDNNRAKKFKNTANDKKVDGVTQREGAPEWKQPLKRHVNPATGETEFVTILVRVLSGDAEHDFHARFPNEALLPEAVCAAIAEKEMLDKDDAKLFTLWVVSKDLGPFHSKIRDTIETRPRYI